MFVIPSAIFVHNTLTIKNWSSSTEPYQVGIVDVPGLLNLARRTKILTAQVELAGVSGIFIMAWKRQDCSQ